MKAGYFLPGVLILAATGISIPGGANDEPCEGTFYCTQTDSECVHPAIGVSLCATARAFTRQYPDEWCASDGPKPSGSWCVMMEESGSGQATTGTGAGHAVVSGHSSTTCVWDGIIRSECGPVWFSKWHWNSIVNGCFQVTTEAFIDLTGTKASAVAIGDCPHV